MEETITRDQIMEFFRSDRDIEELTEDDKNEIAICCLSYNNSLCEIIDNALDLMHGKK